METTKIDPVALSGTLIAEVLLGKIRFSTHQYEPHYLPRLRQLAMQLKKTLGEGGFEAYAADWLPAVHVLADALFDAVTGVDMDKTKKGLKDLTVVQRVAVEQIAARATGKTRREERWADELWEIKKTLNDMVTQSISEITPEEIRKGFDPLVHAIVDHLFEHRKTLVN